MTSLDSHHRLETPENVEVEFHLAGPGSRLCAVLIDSVIIYLLLVVLVSILFVLFQLQMSISDTLFDGSGSLSQMRSWGMAVIVLAFFVFTSGYYMVMEAMTGGQTLGKRAMGLRVVREDATAVSLTDVVLRNLIRTVDLLPGFYLLGGLVAWWHPRHKRLGDLAAGTIVVKEASLHDSLIMPEIAHPRHDQAAFVNQELTAEEVRLIRDFHVRCPELKLEIRQALAQRLARTMWDRHGGQAGRDPELYLQRLLEGTHHDG